MLRKLCKSITVVLYYGCDVSRGPEILPAGTILKSTRIRGERVLLITEAPENMFKGCWFTASDRWIRKNTEKKLR